MFVSNIYYEVDVKDLTNLFETKVGKVLFIDLVLDKNHRFNGCAIVEFGNPLHVSSAIDTLNGTIFLGRKIWVSKNKRSVSDFLRIPQI